MIHSFTEKLYFSKSKEGALDDIYKSYFKNVVDIQRIERMDRQHAGIDTEILLESGERIIVQEKWRTREFTNDFLIEYISVERNGECISPGWIYTIDAQYIFAVYAPSNLVKIYPAAQLKLVWQANEEEWINKYRLPPARNNGYNTHNVAVPCDILETKLIEQMTFTFQRQLSSSFGGVM
jgi:hypothetical protein